MIGRLVSAFTSDDGGRLIGFDAQDGNPATETDADGGSAADEDGDVGGDDVGGGAVALERAAGRESDAHLEFLELDERVLFLLSEHDGRLPQQTVVEETGYSAARISELLREMEADGRVNRYWDDGGKVITFPEFDSE